MIDAEWDREVLGPILARVATPSPTAIAFHEAGHAVVARGLGVEVHVVSIRPGEGHLGVAVQGAVGRYDDFDLGPWWEHPLSVTSVARSITIALAGYVAEAMVSPSASSTGRPDVSRAAGTEAVAQLSPSDFALLRAAEAEASPEDDGSAAWRLAEALTGSVSEAASFLTLMRASTRRLVHERAEQIAAVAHELLRTVVLDGRAVDRVINKEIQ